MKSRGWPSGSRRPARTRRHGSAVLASRDDVREGPAKRTGHPECHTNPEVRGLASCLVQLLLKFRHDAVAPSSHDLEFCAYFHDGIGLSD
ncbi:hypothetical protein MTO96_032160 [Rhipicephalus appendiculatus]